MLTFPLLQEIDDEVHLRRTARVVSFCFSRHVPDIARPSDPGGDK
jgi:hypothetical protein